MYPVSSWHVLGGGGCALTRGPTLLGHLPVGAAGLWAEPVKAVLACKGWCCFIACGVHLLSALRQRSLFQTHNCYPLARQNICWIQPRGVLISRYNILSFSKVSIIS